MQGHGLVVQNVAPSFTFTSDELGVETPGNDGVDDDVVRAVDVVFFGNGEELTVSIT